jgi:ATP-dependent RNA helicase RhlE
MIQAPPQRTHGFYGLGIAPNLLEAIARLRFETPTPIQEKAIPVALQGTDVVGIAQTGTGKTLAFAVPMMQRLAATHGRGRGLILVPTRELALQVDETYQQVGKHLGLRTAVVIGGASMGPQIAAIRRQPHVIVATPGRLLDHLEQKTVSLGNIAVLVLDEADRMLDMGFAPQLNRILAVVPRERQTMLFSATMPEEIARMAAKHMKLPVRVEVAPGGTPPEQVDQEIFVIPKAEKQALLEKLLDEHRGSVLVFTRTKFSARKVARVLSRIGHSTAELHSNRSLNQRRAALDGFKSGEYRVLVATDIAARGIDVKGIELVINFDLPAQAEDYVHRIGRTARAGATGKAISFATPDQTGDIRAIERLVRVRLPVSRSRTAPPAAAGPEAEGTAAPGTRPHRGAESGHHRPGQPGGGHGGHRPHGPGSRRRPRHRGWRGHR